MVSPTLREVVPYVWTEAAVCLKIEVVKLEL